MKMPSKKLQILEKRQELDDLVKEYLEQFDTHTDQESKYFIETIKEKQREIFRLEKRRKDDATRHVQLQQEIKN